MPTKFISTAFAGGIISKEFHGRTDLEKYALSLADGDNYVIDYRGGAKSRAGTEMIDPIPFGHTGVVFTTFKFNNQINNTYLLMFVANYIYFAQNGVLVLEANKTITSMTAGVATLNAHGYNINDHVKINNIVYKITAVTTNTFTLATVLGVAVNISGSGVTVARIYSVGHNMNSSEITTLTFRQRGNDLTICTNARPVYTLNRAGHTSWTLTLRDFTGTAIASPTGKNYTPSAAGAASFAWTVTSVSISGEESLVNSIVLAVSCVNFTTTAGSIAFTWNAVAGAKYYKIYRSLVYPASTGANAATLGHQLGYIGKSIGTSFSDTNIIPDFTQSPPVELNPISAGRIYNISITAKGSGYTNATVSISSPGGTGFVGQAIINNGQIVGVTVLNGGAGYFTGTTFVTITGDGTGATATADLGPQSGTAPACSLYFNARQWFFGQQSFPMRLLGSRPDSDFFTFNTALFGGSLDPIYLDIDAEEVTPIKFAEIVNDSMFVFTTSSVWQISYADGKYTPSQRTQNGIGSVKPLLIDREILFPLSGGTGIWSLRPSNLPNFYIDVDMSLYARDMFTADNEITSWGFAKEPDRIVWAGLKDGKFLSMTYVPTQNVYAWMKHSTQGYVKALASLRENSVDSIYLGVLRNGIVYLERMRTIEPATVEDDWSVDCALRTTHITPAATLSISGDTCTASAAVFSIADVGKHLRAGGGRGSVTGYISSTQLTVHWQIPVAETGPQSQFPPVFASGDWTLDPLVSSVSGLNHLEGQLVQIFADGSYYGDRTVVNGSVALDVPASQVLVGLAFSGFIELLPLTASDVIIEDRKKRIVDLTVLMKKTRGFSYSVDGNEYPMKERSDEEYSAPTRFQDGKRTLTILGNWRPDPVIRFHKRGPNTSHIISVVYSVEVGDDPS